MKQTNFSLTLLATILAWSTPLWAEVTAEGARYRVVSDGDDQKLADEMVTVLDAAYAEFQKHFKAKPKLKKGAKLEVRHFVTEEKFQIAVRATGEPPTKAGGIYLPSTKIAYFQTQPTRYYTRVLMLHETAHQFHYLARTKNKEPTARWYTEGLAEYLSWHHWDGKTLQLGVRPLISLNDRAKAALAEIDGADIEAFVEGKTDLSRPIAWALVRWMATGGKNGKPHKKFVSFTKKMDAGNKPASLFRKFFGTPKSMKPEFVKWIKAEQSPWVWGFNEWEPLSNNSLRGFAKQYTVAYLRDPAPNLTATLVVPEKPGWNIGVTLHWTSADDYSVALLNYAGFMHIVRRTEGRWQTLEKGAVPGLEPGLEKGKRCTFQLFRRGAEVSMLVNQVGFGPWELPGQTFGLALRNCDATFVDIKWK